MCLRVTVLPCQYYLLHGAESFLRSFEKVCSWSRNSPHFTETEGLLSHSQASAICPYPGPAQSSLYTHIPPPWDPTYFYPPIYAYVSPVVSFPPVSPPTPYTPPPPHPYAPHAQPISFISILSPTKYWVRSTSHLAPRYAVFSIPLLPRPS